MSFREIFHSNSKVSILHRKLEISFKLSRNVLVTNVNKLLTKCARRLFARVPVRHYVIAQIDVKMSKFVSIDVSLKRKYLFLFLAVAEMQGEVS